MTEKPTIVVYGNCAGQFLAEQLRGLPTVRDQYDIRWVRSFLVQSKGDEPIDLSVLSRCAILLEQVGNFRDDVQRRGGAHFRDLPVPTDCRRIRFPPLFMNTLWPFVTYDPRSEAAIRPWFEEGPYPRFVANRLILDIMKEERDPEKVFERFCSIRIKDKVDLDRLHALTLAKIRALDQNSDVKVGDFIDRHFTSKRLFLVQIHPAGALLRHLCEEVFRAMGLPADVTQDRLADLERARGIGAYDAPIHPEIIEHFGLSWASDLAYVHYVEGYFTHDEFIRRYIRLEWNPLVYLGMHLARGGQALEAETVLTAAAARPGATSTIFQQLGQVRHRLGWTDQARAAFMAAAYAPRGMPSD